MRPRDLAAVCAFAGLFVAGLVVAGEGAGFVAVSRAVRRVDSTEARLLGAAGLAAVSYALLVLVVRLVAPAAAAAHAAALVAGVAMVTAEVVLAYVLLRESRLGDATTGALVGVARGFHAFGLLALAFAAPALAPPQRGPMRAAALLVTGLLVAGAVSLRVADYAETAFVVWVLLLLTLRSRRTSDERH